MNPVQICFSRSPQTLPGLLPAIRAARQQGQRVIVLVPEQYTLQAEWELVTGLQVKGLLDVDVLSPTGLTRLIRERAGGTPLPLLDDRGRAMAFSMALVRCQKELSYYRDAVEMPGLPSRLSRLVQDLEKAGLGPNALRALEASAPTTATRLKEKDIARLWLEAEQLMQDRFVSEEKYRMEAIDRLALSGIMQGAALFVCGFDALQPWVISLMVIAYPLAAQVQLAMCMGERNARGHVDRVFLAQNESVEELEEALDDAGIPHTLCPLPPTHPTRDAALVHLTRVLFSTSRTPADIPAASVQIHTAADHAAEAAWAAAQLHAWHRAGIPWGRMAINLADTSALPAILAETLSQAGIPHYIVRKDSAARHGLSRFLIGALRAACQGFRQADVLLAARSGFAPLTDEEALRLENYALENGIDRHKWLTPFTRGENAEDMEPLREALITPLDTLRTGLRAAKDARASMEAIWHCLENVDAYERLRAREAELLRRGMMTELSQNRQMWQLILSLLEETCALLGGQRASMRHIARMLEAGLVSAQVASLPPQPDTVMVGEAGHLMTGDIDCLVLMGMQDGITATHADSLLTEAERASLSVRADTTVGLPKETQDALRLSDLYRTIALPRRALALTCASADVSGKALRPSVLLSQVQAVLPQVTCTGGIMAESSQPLSPMMALSGLAQRLRAWQDGHGEAPGPQWQAACAALLRSPRWQSTTQAVLSALHAELPTAPLQQKTASAVMRQQTVSISRIERFASCPYSHFVRYCLRPVTRRDFTFAADDRGNYFHEVLRRYTELAAAESAWPDLPDAQIEALLNQAVAEAQQDWAGGPLEEDETGRQLGEEYTRAVRRAAWLFTRHARRTRFSAARAEVSFGAEGTLPPVILELSGGRRVALEGIIDRVDDWTDGQTLYRRLVDYKSSDRDIDPVMVRHGLQLQLLLYMLAATAEESAVPAGMFYFTVRNPMITLDSDVQEEAERLIAKELRLKGVALADAHVVEAMNGGEEGETLPAIFKKDGSLRKNAMACDREEMHALMDSARSIAIAMTERLLSGEVIASPAKTTDGLPCTWCDVKLCCPRDTALPGLADRDYSHEDPEQAWQELIGHPAAGGEV